MTESTGLSITSGFVLWLGPYIGPWIAVLLASIIGSLWTVGNVETKSRAFAGLVLVRIVLTSLVLTGIVSSVLSSYVSQYVPVEYLPVGVAFGISVMGDRLKEFKDVAIERLKTMIGK